MMSGSARRRITSRFLAVGLLVLAAPVAGQRQVTVLNSADTTIQVGRGKAALLRLDFDMRRVSLGDPAIADILGPDSVFPREFQVLGLQIGATNLIIWPLSGGQPVMYNIEVTADATALQTQLRTLFPDENISVATSGGAIILSGTVDNPTIARRAAALAAQTGAQVINNLQAPSAEQVLLQVRIAEVRRTAGSGLGVDLAGNNVGQLDQIFGEGSTADIETLSEGLMRLFLIGQNANLDATIRALKSKGEYRSLAEPNLVTMEGQPASFLAGGEFPYPTVQAGGGSNAASNQVSIVFKEFGVRLNFTPTVTNGGTIVLEVAPEVSSLDFANGLTFAGYQIPSLLTRRAESTVELRPGQHLAIAGLLDNVLSDNVTKIPFLGDLPVLGALFRSRSNDQARTELLVIVTPHLIEASDTAPGVPSGEPRTWRWDRNMRVDTTRGDVLPARRRSGGD